MLTLILPGYSPKNKSWAYETKDNIKVPGEIIVHEWWHWQTGGELDMGYETQRILTVIGVHRVDFIAKSIGTEVLMHVIPKINNQVRKIILCGIPMNPLEHLRGLKNINPDNIIVFQNSRDPFMSYKTIDRYLHLINKNIKVYENESDTHHYPYYEDFTKFLTGD